MHADVDRYQKRTHSVSEVCIHIGARCDDKGSEVRLNTAEKRTKSNSFQRLRSSFVRQWRTHTAHDTAASQGGRELSWALLCLSAKQATGFRRSSSLLLKSLLWDCLRCSSFVLLARYLGLKFAGRTVDRHRELFLQTSAGDAENS